MQITMGKLTKTWKEGNAKNITFCVTEDCNLACRYCYMTGKNKKKKMNFDIAKKAVDYLLDTFDGQTMDAVVWEFIGGEPFLEIDLIDMISDYLKQQMFLRDHPWFNAYRFSFSSNGLLYNTPKVQRYIEKNKGHISVGMSIDGNKIKHDAQRVKPDGSGSYDDVIKNVPLWSRQFPGHGTKATFAHDDIPYLKDSVISLWKDLDIKMVMANVVFEDVWHEGDDIIFESQLKELADYIIEEEMWRDYSVRFFDPHIGFPLSDRALKQNFCGSGKMLAIDCEGRLYPCVRFYDFSLNNRKGYVLGDIYTGINPDRVRPFEALSLETQSSDECMTCKVASGCAWCTGCNYDMADTDTIYQRAIFLCKMHKANVRANEYFWDKFAKTTGLMSPRQEYISESGGIGTKFLQILLSDDVTPHCSYRNFHGSKLEMSKNILYEGLAFAEKNNMTPVFLGNPSRLGYNAGNSIVFADPGQANGGAAIIIYDNEAEDMVRSSDNCILLVNKSNISNICFFIRKLCANTGRINLILEETEKWEESDLDLYKSQLDELADIISNAHLQGKAFELNILNDIMGTKNHLGCDAGVDSFTLAPNGRLYNCPAFYFNDPDDSIGSLEKGFSIKNARLYELKNQPICKECDAYHCIRCKFLNKKITGQINVPSKIQCIISHLERNKARELQQILKKETSLAFFNNIKETEYLDPLEKIANKEWGALNV